jgi:hypothetical protein
MGSELRTKRSSGSQIKLWSVEDYRERSGMQTEDKTFAGTHAPNQAQRSVTSQRPLAACSTCGVSVRQARLKGHEAKCSRSHPKGSAAVTTPSEVSSNQSMGALGRQVTNSIDPACTPHEDRRPKPTSTIEQCIWCTIQFKANVKNSHEETCKATHLAACTQIKPSLSDRTGRDIQEAFANWTFVRCPQCENHPVKCGHPQSLGILRSLRCPLCNDRFSLTDQILDHMRRCSLSNRKPSAPQAHPKPSAEANPKPQPSTPLPGKKKRSKLTKRQKFLISLRRDSVRLGFSHVGLSASQGKFLSTTVSRDFPDVMEQRNTVIVPIEIKR